MSRDVAGGHCFPANQNYRHAEIVPADTDIPPRLRISRESASDGLPEYSFAG
jgi:hypothetical protein